jgi:hypothetical protein
MRHSIPVTNPDNRAESYIVDSYSCYISDRRSDTATRSGSSASTRDKSGNNNKRSAKSTKTK